MVGKAGEGEDSMPGIEKVVIEKLALTIDAPSLACPAPRSEAGEGREEKGGCGIHVSA